MPTEPALVPDVLPTAAFDPRLQLECTEQMLEFFKIVDTVLWYRLKRSVLQTLFHFQLQLL